VSTVLRGMRSVLEELFDHRLSSVIIHLISCAIEGEKGDIQ